MEQLPTGLIWIVLGFAFKELYDWAKNKLYKQDDDKDGQLEENTKAIHGLNLNLVKMDTTLIHLSEKLTAIPKLESFVHELSAQVREVRASLKIKTQ